MKSVVPQVVLILSMACVGAAREKETTQTIKITADSFSDIYPAVWFSPADGTVTPLTERSEKPPQPKFKIWIEPNDPEFAILDREAFEQGEQGFQLLGHGKAHFQNPELPAERDLADQVPVKTFQKPHAVLLFVDGKKSYVMLIESFSKERQELTFQWKLLASD